MPSSSNRGSYKGVYKLVPQGDGSPIGDALDCGAAAAADAGYDFPLAAEAVLASSSYVESLLGDAMGDAMRPVGIETQGPYTAQDFLESHCMQGMTILVIFLNAIVIGFETDMPHLTQWDVIENVFLAIFTIELGTKLAVIGPTHFFRCRNNPDITWNWFDFAVVTVGIINVFIELVIGKSGNAKDATLFRMVRLLRILRVLRIIRIVRFLKQLYLLAYGFMEGAMAVFWVTLLASFALYICSVILVRTYGRTTHDDLEASEEDDWDFFRMHFGNIPRSMFNLFEVLAAPDLSSYKRIMFKYPPLCFFYVLFVILGSFGLNGLLVAIINESILEKNQARLEADRMEREAKRKMMQGRVRELFDSIDVNGNRVLPRNEIKKCKGQLMQLFEESGAVFRAHDLDQMFYIMDFNDSGIIERAEFVSGVVEMCDQIRPMSIMELHCQVSKCASKIEACDNKMEGLAKAMEVIEAQEEERLKQCDSLVSRLSLTADKMHMVQTGQGRQEQPLAVLPSSSSRDLEFQRLLEVEQNTLAEASALVSALLGRGSSASASSTLSAALFRLHNQTNDVLEALSVLPEELSQELPPQARPAERRQSAVVDPLRPLELQPPFLPQESFAMDTSRSMPESELRVSSLNQGDSPDS